MINNRSLKDYDEPWTDHRTALSSSDNDVGAADSGSAVWAGCRGRRFLTAGIAIQGGTGVTYSAETWLKDFDANVYKAPDFDLVSMTDPATFRVNLDEDYAAYLVILSAVAGTTPDIDIRTRLG